MDRKTVKIPQCYNLNYTTHLQPQQQFQDGHYNSGKVYTRYPLFFFSIVYLSRFILMSCSYIYVMSHII